jgi:small subunit ribosomal protein S20
LKSGIKRHKQSLKRRIRNRHVRSTVKSAIKDVREAIAGSDAPAAAGALSSASSVLARAAKKGVLHRKTASRKVSRLARALHKASAGK